VAEPTYPNRPDTVRRFTNKYSSGGPLSTFLSTLSPTTSTALRALDASYANVGRNPLTTTQTRLAATAADQNRAVTPEPDRGFFGDLAHDATTIAGAIPRLPATLISEVRQVANLPAAMEEVRADPNANLASYANLPGLRLLPGSFVVGSFAPDQGGVDQLIDHPLMTALDVLPFASKAAKLTPTVRTAERLAAEAAPVTRLSGSPTRTPPLTTLARNWRPGGPVTQTVEKFGQPIETLAPNPVGAALDKVKTTLQTRTAPGRFAAKAFGEQARATNRLANRTAADAYAGDLRGYSGADADLTTIAFDVVENARALRKEYADLGPERIAEVTEVARRGRAEEMAALAPREAEFISRLAEVRYREDAQLAVKSLRDTLSRNTDYAAPPAQLLTDLRTMLADAQLPGKTKRTLAQGYLTALDEAGYSTTKLYKLAQDSKPAQVAEALTRRLPETVDELPTFTPSTAVTDAIATLRATPHDPITRDLFTALRDGNDATARRALFTLQRRTKSIPDISFEDLRAQFDRNRRFNKTFSNVSRAGFTDGALGKARRLREATEARAVPARFQGAVQAQFDETVRATLADADLSAEQLSAAFDALETRAYDMIGPAADLTLDIGKMKAEAAASWRTLKAQGIDPVFVPNVSRGRAAALQSPRVLDHVPTLAQTKARLWDSGDTLNDMALAIEARGLEVLVQQGSRAFVEQITPMFGTTEALLRERFMPRAVRAHARNPSTSLEGHLRHFIDREYRFFDPESFISGRKPPGRPPANAIYLPRAVADNLDALRPRPSELGQLVSTPMKIFRTALLPLSLRWHVYNMVGGAVMLMARAENPVTVWRYLNRARALMKEGGVEGLARRLDDPAEIAAARGAAPGGAIRQETEWFRDIKRSDDPNVLAARTRNVAAGRTLRRLFDTVVQKSYNANQFVDDLYRSMAYLEGSDRALTRGLSRAESIAKGVEAGRAIMQNWDTMTPLERSAMRFVFPFYSWTRHLLKYALTYPADHPWRMSIMSNMARAEMTDWNTGLPQRLRELLFIGDMDADGNQLGLSLSGMNPFRDVANYFTLAGFMAGEGDISTITSQVNPFISTALQAAGIDPSTGAPDLYPTLEFDPLTGSMKVAQTGGPGWQQALGNFLPQSKVVTNLLGLNDEFNDLQRRNPQAAQRMIQSGLGIPVTSREVNVPQEIMKAEVIRYEALRDTINASRKAGDYGNISSQYPGLAAFARRLEALDASKPGQRAVTMAGNEDPDRVAQILGGLNPVG
jgi:hypothetical protein